MSDHHAPVQFRKHAAAAFGLLAFATLILRWQGRVFWCQCHRFVPWSWDIWSKHNSQHLVDPYFFTHVLHGIVFYGLLHACRPDSSRTIRFWMAIVLETAWELVENSPLIINRYREVTISLDYFGDSIANSLVDIIACGLGFLLSSRLKPLQSLAVFLTSELILLLWIRDGLMLNIVMLVWPIEAVKLWQMSAGGL